MSETFKIVKMRDKSLLEKSLIVVHIAALISGLLMVYYDVLILTGKSPNFNTFKYFFFYGGAYLIVVSLLRSMKRE